MSCYLCDIETSYRNFVDWMFTKRFLFCALAVLGLTPCCLAGVSSGKILGVYHVSVTGTAANVLHSPVTPSTKSPPASVTVTAALHSQTVSLTIGASAKINGAC